MVKKDILLDAYSLMCTAREMALTYEANRQICKYVHSTSRGHEAVQIATGMQLMPYDFCSPYYRDDAMLLSIGLSPYELMLQLLAKGEDPFTGGRSYYSHPALRRAEFPVIPHQSSATGMQAIPATGMAHAIAYKESQEMNKKNESPIVLCSLGDAAITEGEVAEAFQMAVLKQLPIIFLIQDNEWGISASADEMRAMDAFEYAAGFKGMKRLRLDGSDFVESYECLENAITYVRKQRKPVLIHAKLPLLNHHTSGVRKEWYRSAEDIARNEKNDPIPKLRELLIEIGVEEKDIHEIEKNAKYKVEQQFTQAVDSPEPDLSLASEYVFAPGGITEEKGVRSPENHQPVVMVDAALHAVDELLRDHPECVFYGQDVGERLGGVFREAATLATKYGSNRVFNTPIQEAYIVGSTVGMSAAGIKPIVEVQFADYVWTGINQLVCEISKSSYLSLGKFPVGCIIRIPIGAYGGGGPYHSGSIESTLLTIKGIKIGYPSNAADMKGLMKSAFYDGNPVIMLEHKGLYWSKNPGTEQAKCIEPSDDYVLPFGKANTILHAGKEEIETGNTCVVITYGMGVYWSTGAAKNFPGRVEVVDLRSLQPLDEPYIMEAVKRHGKCLVVTEEPLLNSFAESLAGRISQQCFKFLDAPVATIGSMNVPAIPLNIGLEAEVLPNIKKVSDKLNSLLHF